MLFLPLTLTVFVRIQNTFRKIKVVYVMCIMFRDNWIILFLKFPYFAVTSVYISIKRYKKHHETSRKLKIYKGMFFETR